MMVSDEDLAYAREHLGLNIHDYGIVDHIIAELVALRKVAEGALALERAMKGIPCECNDKSCEVMCKALREAGL